jgi:hypothetical protein
VNGLGGLLLRLPPRVALDRSLREAIVFAYPHATAKGNRRSTSNSSSSCGSSASATTRQCITADAHAEVVGTSRLGTDVGQGRHHEAFGHALSSRTRPWKRPRSSRASLRSAVAALVVLPQPGIQPTNQWLMPRPTCVAADVSSRAAAAALVGATSCSWLPRPSSGKSLPQLLRCRRPI